MFQKLSIRALACDGGREEETKRYRHESMACDQYGLDSCSMEQCRVLTECPEYVEPDNEKAAKILLANCGAQENILMPYKMYRCSLPLVAQADMQSIALMMVSNTETIAPLNPVQIKLDVKNQKICRCRSHRHSVMSRQ